MRRLVAALVLASTVSLTMMVPSASAQFPFPYGGFGFGGPTLESFGFSNGTPFFSTTLSGPAGIACQYGAYLNNTGTTGVLGGINPSNVNPFFTASAIGPVFGPGPCTPPPHLLGGGGIGHGCCSPIGIGGGSGGLAGLGNATLAQLAAAGLITCTTAAGTTTTTCTIAGVTITLAAGQTTGSTTLAAAAAANPALALALGGGLGGFGGFGVPGLGGLGGFTGLGGLGLGGGNCTPVGTGVVVCQR